MSDQNTNPGEKKKGFFFRILNSGNKSNCCDVKIVPKEQPSKDSKKTSC
jgi:hypothetical protein